MKYIKEYNEYDKLEELSEYLQEMFDKFDIRMSEPVYIGAGGKLPQENLWFIENVVKGTKYICIHFKDREYIDKVFQEINNIRSTVEKRIEREIIVIKDEGYSCIYITFAIISGKLTRFLKRPILKESHNSIEDFEDYFQELFDKYNIISKNRQIPPRGVMAYDEEDNQIYYSTMDSKLLGRNICLTNVNKEMGDKIVNDIEKMLPNLEKRIGNTLRIDYKKTTYGINSYYIRIEYIKET